MSSFCFLQTVRTSLKSSITEVPGKARAKSFSLPRFNGRRYRYEVEDIIVFASLR
jgi:hypothetical protein